VKLKSVIYTRLPKTSFVDQRQVWLYAGVYLDDNIMTTN